MNPHLTPRDYEIYKRYISSSKYYFEYGSGGSTYEAAMIPTIENIYSVESDINWINTIQSKLTDKKNITFFYIDLKSNGNWGNPGPKCSKSEYKKYSDAIYLVDKSKIDTVLIDGRFRVACALKCLILENAVILIDDFLNRPYYGIILNYYDVIEKGDRLVCLKKKQNVSVPIELIKKYELITQ